MTMVNSEPGDENSVERDAYKYIVQQALLGRPGGLLRCQRVVGECLPLLGWLFFHHTESEAR